MELKGVASPLPPSPPFPHPPNPPPTTLNSEEEDYAPLSPPLSPSSSLSRPLSPSFHEGIPDRPPRPYRPPQTEREREREKEEIQQRLHEEFTSWMELRPKFQARQTILVPGVVGEAGGEEDWLEEMEEEEEEWRRLLAGDQMEEDEGGMNLEEEILSFGSDDEEEEEDEEEVKIMGGISAHLPENIPAPTTNLEVMGDRAIAWLLFGMYGGIVVACLLSIAYVIVTYQVFYEETVLIETNYLLLRLDAYLLGLLSVIFLVVLVLYLVWIRAYSCIFECCFRGLRMKRTGEQKYLAFCLFGLFFAFNPVGSIQGAISVWFENEPPPEGFMSNLANIAYQIATQFFILKMIKHFGYHHANGRTPRKRQLPCIPFDVKDVLVIMVPCLYKIFVGSSYHIAFDFSPVGNLLSMFTITAVAVNNDMVPEPSWFMLILGCIFLDCLSYSYTIYEGKKAFRRLGDVPYAPNRRKQLGFRFFMSHTVTCWVAYNFVSTFLVASTPPRRYFMDYYEWRTGIDSESNGTNLLLGVTYAYSILALIILVWAIEIVFVNKPLARDYTLWEASAYTSTEKQNELVFESKISTHFCLESCINLLNFAKLVYSRASTPEDFNLIVNCATAPNDVVAYFKREQTDTHCLIAAGPDRIIVAFRGTKTITNFITDVNILQSQATSLLTPPNLPKSNSQKESSREEILDELDVMLNEHDLFTNDKFKGAAVHAGFLSAYMSIRDEVMSKIAELLKEKNRPVVVTGHSLGGALGMLFGYDLSLHQKCLWKLKKYNSSPLVQIVTFGSPRVGNPAFSRHFNSVVHSCFRVVCARDIITHLPFSSVGNSGFKHCGVMVLLDPKGNMLVNPSVVEKSWWHFTFFQSKITRHLLPCYIRYLNRLVVRVHPEDVEFKIWKKNASFTPIPTEIETEDEKGCMSSFFCCCQGVTQGDDVIE